MWGPTLIQALGSTGLFASRAFLPAFAAALILRFGVHMPVIGDWGLLAYLGVGQAPAWFTSDLSLLVLGALSLLEVTASKSTDARAVLDLVDKYFKPVMAALTTLGVATAVDGEFAGQIMQGMGEAEASLGLPPGGAAVLTPVAAGMTLSGVSASVAAAGTFVLGSVRSFLTGLFQDVDEDDDTGLQKLLSWAEDLWSFFGLWFLVLFPLVMLTLIGVVTGFVLLLRWWAHRKEEASKVPCGSCGEPMYRCALACGNCRTPNPEVCDVGWLGQSRAHAAADRATQPLQLIEAKRCAVCATKLPRRCPRQVCPRCGTDALADPALADAYLRRVSQRLPWVLVVSGLLGSVWIIGVIPAVILYRWTLVAPFRRYIPRGRNLLAKWGLRLAFFLLLASQLVPFLGLVTVPVMAAMSFVAYRQMFAGMLDDPPAGCEDGQPATTAAADR